MDAKPYRLTSGRWGAAVAGDSVQVGDTVTIRTSNGTAWEARVTKIVSKGATTIAETESLDRAVPARSPSMQRRAAATHRPVRGCQTCRDLGRMCDRCAFDEFDN